MEQHLVETSKIAGSRRPANELTGNKATWKAPTIVILENNSIEGAKGMKGSESAGSVTVVGPS